LATGQHDVEQRNRRGCINKVTSGDNTVTKHFNTKKLTLVSLALAASLSSSYAMAEVSGEIGVTNDYRFRGVSQSAGEFAIQGGIDWSHDSGFFLGTWGSNVDFDDPEAGNGANLELDLYMGYAGEIEEGLTYDVTLYRYTYPGDDVSQDYFELTAGMDFSGFRAAYWYTNDYGNGGQDLHYLDLNYGWGFAEIWSLDLHYGFNVGDALDDGTGFNSYSDYSVGVSAQLGDFNVSLAWLDTDLSGDYEIADGSFKNKGTVLASMTYAF
jgi:uncharacterized protein (TIGR02001 family)